MKSTNKSRNAVRAASLLLLGALLGCAARASAAEGLLGPELLLERLEADCEERLGVDVQLRLLEALPALKCRSADYELAVRYSPRAGQWLPDALLLREAGRQTASLPLYRYVEFSLPVLVAPAGLSARSLIRSEQLETQVLPLRAGREVLCDMARASGCEARLAVRPGGQVLHSALRAPYDIRRGEELTLVLRLPGLEVQASATALCDAYIGQRITVRRSDDRRQFSGLLSAGPQVVVE
jgi:flagella basal body P-ring formation protein FlgA